ncbi:hypothetical protein [Photobacterium sp. TLY01]|uniref:hypothetical protein n=1 Tax=Photobacterium sp. TLY01 TaxID=2907534 RepID=UPI001F38EEB0|nr:hypothetical protein [Photobacterium sp. TLY01]UIP30690.1 hypothetical protein LN341_18480 [Photobacterium sp. TLY01]
MRARYAFGAKEYPEMPCCSLVLSGSVVGAPGAGNLKICPEFFPLSRIMLKLIIALKLVRVKTYIHFKDVHLSY